MSADVDSSANYRAIFAPEGDITVFGGEDPLAYCWSESIKLVVNVAMATGRALLLQGEPGVGKSVVAEAVAEVMGWRFYSHTVSSRTEAQDLTWKFDYVRRLGDAQAKIARDECAYLIPGPFWWAFDIDSAERQGGPKSSPPCLPDPSQKNRGRRRDGAVVLIDEIDKADPAVANDLLETVGSGRFDVNGVTTPFPVEWRGERIQTMDDRSDDAKRGGLLMVFTSNNERDLPEAFLRRCIVETMTWPKRDVGEEKVAFDRFLHTDCPSELGQIGYGGAQRPGKPCGGSTCSPTGRGNLGTTISTRAGGEAAAGPRRVSGCNRGLPPAWRPPRHV